MPPVNPPGPAAPAFDASTHLWSGPAEVHFRSRDLAPLRQAPGRCVVTALAILTGQPPGAFDVNTQDPVSWSAALRPHRMKLAYCPTDARKLNHYLPELLAHDDLFTLSYYTSATQILGEPDAHGWVTGSHVVVLHRDRILDPATGASTPAVEHPGMGKHTKRIFRVVPAGHARGL